MRYLEEEDLPVIFDLIGQYYCENEEVPDYRSEANGIEKLQGIFQGVREDVYYPSLLEKAVYLFVQINKGHFFSNGNKRLSLVCGIGFLGINDIGLDSAVSKETYRELFEILFPYKFEMEDQADFTSDEFALYNLAIFIADSSRFGISFDDLKERVHKFLSRMSIPVKY
mgnify:CR=1 FL=1